MQKLNNHNQEIGSIESALSLIPTTAFFLLILQLMLSGSWQMLDKIEIANVINRSALLDSKSPETFFHALDKRREIDEEVIMLPGGGEIITYSSRLDIPVITNLFGGGIRVKSEGIAIRE